MARCRDALAHLHSIEHIKISLVQFQNRQIRGQAQTTHTQNVFAELHKKSRLAAMKYHWSLQALLALRGLGEWQEELHTLSDADIRGPGADAEDGDLGHRSRKKRWTVMEKRIQDIQDEQDPAQVGQHIGEGMREVSWIWMHPRVLSAAASDGSCQEGE